MGVFYNEKFNTVSLMSFSEDVIKDIDGAAKNAIRKAATHMVKSIKEKIKELGIKKHTGNLLEGVYKEIRDDKYGAFFGFGPPAYHAHLLELGTVERHTKTGKSTGKINRTPILAPVVEEQAEAVADILADRWLA